MANIIIRRKRHGGWDGFEPIRNERHVITHAKCKNCFRMFVKRDEQTLKRHRTLCLQGTENDQNTSNMFSDDSMAYANLFEEYEEDIHDVDIKPRIIEHIEVKRSSSLTEMQKWIQILKFFICTGVDSSKVKDLHFMKMIQAFDENFKFPSPEDLDTSVTKIAMEESYKCNKEKAHSSVMCLKMYENDDNIMFLTLLLNSSANDAPTYIDSKIIENNSDVDIHALLNDFLTDSLTKAYSFYNVIVKFIIHDGLMELESEKHIALMIQNRVYDYICTILVGIDYVIEKLKNISFTISVHDSSLLQKYYDSLNSLSMSLKTSNLSLSEATKDLFMLVNGNEIFQHTIFGTKASETLYAHIHSIHLASLYFHPQNRGQSFLEDPELFEKFENYLQRLASVNQIFDDLAYYKDKYGYFNKLYADDCDLDYIRFWKIIKVKNPNLAEYALNLLSLPATTVQLDMKYIYEKFLTSNNDKLLYRSFLFSVIWENRQ